MTKMDIKIEGMHCGTCAAGIKMLISSMDGMGEVYIDFRKKSGSFEFDESRVSREQIVKAIGELGYTAF